MGRGVFVGYGGGYFCIGYFIVLFDVLLGLFDFFFYLVYVIKGGFCFFLSGLEYGGDCYFCSFIYRNEIVFGLVWLEELSIVVGIGKSSGRVVVFEILD